MLDYFQHRYDKVPNAVWARRFAEGLVQADGVALGLDSPYEAGLKIGYFRQGRVEEPPVNWNWSAVYEDEDLLVVDKPHGLPVMPSGRYVARSLVTALKLAFENSEIVPLHRLDRDTSGLVAFSKRAATRRPLSLLFVPGRIRKEYRALCETRGEKPSRQFSVTGRIEVEIPHWKRRLMQDGETNSETEFLTLRANENFAWLAVRPRTGKTHQIRVHLASVGLPIVNDRVYRDGLPPEAADLSHPLQLQAFKLTFIHPVSGQPRVIRSRLRLSGLRLL